MIDPSDYQRQAIARRVPSPPRDPISSSPEHLARWQAAALAASSPAERWAVLHVLDAWHFTARPSDLPELVRPAYLTLVRSTLNPTTQPGSLRDDDADRWFS